MREFSWIERIFALRAWKVRHPAKFGTPARRGAKGTGYGAAPPPRPPLHSPRNTPWGFQFPQPGEGTRLVLRELPSLATLAQVISLRDA